MPELPDLTIYVEHLERRLIGATLEEARVVSPNLLRTAAPPLAEAIGRKVLGVRRQGKRIAIALEGGLRLAFHLMISGRFHWRAREARVPGRVGLAALTFSSGTLTLTEASTRKRAALHVLEGDAALRALDAGGLEVMEASPASFAEALLRENHTLKRALCDPHLLSGIGNAYSDEILHRARLSPLQTTRHLDPATIERLRGATLDVLREWIDRLRTETGADFPEHVTAFREGMAVHGRYRKPCPDCGAPVQRIVHAENETNYCPRCQTGGRLLADRALSRLLHGDWPRTLEELDERASGG